MSNKPYSDKLKDPRWQKRRLEIMERDNFACRICLDTKTTLHIHHKEYIDSKDPWDYPDNLLLTLCRDCHSYLGMLLKVVSADPLELSGTSIQLDFPVNAMMKLYHFREYEIIVQFNEDGGVISMLALKKEDATDLHKFYAPKTTPSL